MTGYCPSSFFFLFGAFMDRDGVEVNKPAKKKNEANMQPS